MLWVQIAGVAVTVLVNVVLIGLSFGSVLTRVKVLEGKISVIDPMALSIARVEIRVENVIDQMKDLNASIRWLRHPADPNAPS